MSCCISNRGDHFVSPADGGFICGDGSSAAWIQRVSEEWDRYFARVFADSGHVSVAGSYARTILGEDGKGVGDSESVVQESQRGCCSLLLEDVGVKFNGINGSGGSGISRDIGNFPTRKHVCVERAREDGKVCEIGDKGVDIGGILLGPNGGKSIGRGPNYERNQRVRERNKAYRNKVDQVKEDSCGKFSGPLGSRVSAFGGCSSDVQQKLQESRARMLIAENEARAAKAESYVRHLELVKKSRVNETKFELDRQTVEEKLNKISKRRFGLIDEKGMPTGRVETVVSSVPLGSYSTPSLTSGSISPDSSISMQEVNEMKATIESLSRSEAEARSELKKCNDAIKLLGAEMRGLSDISNTKVLSREAEAIKQFNSAYEYEIPESVGQDYSIPDSCY